MGMIRNHLKETKCKNPMEYERLMEGFNSENDLIRDICNLPIAVIDKYYFQNLQPKKRRGKVNV